MDDSADIIKAQADAVAKGFRDLPPIVLTTVNPLTASAHNKADPEFLDDLYVGKHLQDEDFLAGA